MKAKLDKWGNEKWVPSDFACWNVIELASYYYISLDALVDVVSKKVIYEVGDKRFRSLRKAIKYYYKLVEEYEEEGADNDGERSNRDY